MSEFTELTNKLRNMCSEEIEKTEKEINNFKNNFPYVKDISQIYDILVIEKQIVDMHTFIQELEQIRANSQKREINGYEVQTQAIDAFFKMLEDKLKILLKLSKFMIPKVIEIIETFNKDLIKSMKEIKSEIKKFESTNFDEKGSVFEFFNFRINKYETINSFFPNLIVSEFFVFKYFDKFSNKTDFIKIISDNPKTKFNLYCIENSIIYFIQEFFYIIQYGVIYVIFNDFFSLVSGIKKINSDKVLSNRKIAKKLNQQLKFNFNQSGSRSIEELIFGKNKIPRPSHIYQGCVGDCYILSACMSIAKKQPSLINEIIKINKSKKCIEVYLHPVKFDTINLKFNIDSKVKIELESLINFGERRLQTDKPMWPNCIENAFVVMSKKDLINIGNDKFQLSFKRKGTKDFLKGLLDSGDAALILSSITGKPYLTKSKSDDKEESLDKVINDKKFNDWYSIAFNKDFFLNYGKWHPWEDKSEKFLINFMFKKLKMLGGHAYVILGYKKIKSKDWLIIRNPHSSNLVEFFKLFQKRTKGKIAVDFSAIKQYIKTITVKGS